MFALGRLNFRVGVVAAAASAAWVLQSLTSLALPDPTAVLDVTMIVPILLTISGIWLLRQQGVFGDGIIARIIVGLCAVGLLFTIPGQLAFAFDWGGAGMAAAIVETAALIGALVLAGIAIIRTRMLPRWMGVALIVAQPLAIILGIVFSPISPLADSGDYTGALGHGIVWGLIAAALLGKRIPYLNENPTPTLATGKA
jgi:hypothetical protein